MNALRLSAAKYAPDVFDYGILEGTAADQVRSIAKRIRSRAIEACLETGRDLIAVQDMLGHGNFGKWLAAEFGWTDRTARNFMGAAKLVDGKSEKISVLPVSAIYKLAAPSTPETVRDAIVARVESGDIPSSREIHTAIVEGKKRESDDRAAKAKLDRRLLGKAPKDQERIRKGEERSRRKHEQEQAQQRQEQEKAEEAARAAVELLRSNLGSELPAFAALFKRAGSWRFAAELAAAVPGGSESPA